MARFPPAESPANNSFLLPGAGNIGHDSQVYAAGDITREGLAGVSGDGDEFSTGRGG